MDVLFAEADGTATHADVRDHVVERNARLALDMDASLVNGEVVADLVDLFPGSRYVLTVREPNAWLDSMANHSLAHETPAHWVRWRELRFRSAELTHPPEEAAWRERGALHPRLRLFGIGSPKSGTHSLEGVFAENYRTAHVPERVLAHCAPLLERWFPERLA